MRLIDADAVLERIERNCDARCLYKDYKEPLRSKMCNCCELGDARMYVEDAPTVDAEPIRHGHWIMLHKTHNTDGDNDYDWRCSECNHVDCHNINVEVPYCWYCGAKMDEIVDANKIGEVEE